MKKYSDIKFDLNDISIIPAVISDIDSRSECDVFYRKDFIKSLPLMAAPMDTVIDEKNAHHFYKNNIIACLPRGSKNINLQHPIETDIFYSYGLSEIEEQLEKKLEFVKDSKGVIDIEMKDEDNPFFKHSYVLIDIANGHMKRLIEVIRKIKKYFPYIKLMVGNVAHPLTYKNLAMEGVEYVRCSIGTGAGCTTSANVAINYPMGSLITECKEEKEKGGFETKIVADGGMRGYDDIIKSLALGADYVMIGSLFNQTMQSAGFNYLWGIKLPYDTARKLWKWGFPVKKKYRGMSTKAVQRKWGKAKLVTAEGITKYQKIRFNLCSWAENFEDYLKSNMSYCGARTLDEFIGKVEWEYITNNALQRFKK